MRSQYTIPFKIQVVEEYLRGGQTHRQLAIKYGITLYKNKCASITQWTRLYEAGKLTTDNTIAISHRRKSKHIIVDGEKWLEWGKPIKIINVDGVDYVQG